MTVAEHIESTIVGRKSLLRKESILVAVSGGLDSMVLLQVLSYIAEANQWQLTVAHFNHQLRGRSSDADERLVERTAKDLGLPFVVGGGNVREYARRNKLSLEMAARKLRHEFLARAAAKRKISTIALAHHADDQVELFFVRLLRGAGGDGLAGMKWRSRSPANPKIELVRPLLDQPKSALREYAKARNILFREDATNAQVDILRNRIRHELLPLLEKKYQPAITKIVRRQMEILGAESEFVTDAALAWMGKKSHTPFAELPIAIQRKCLQAQLVNMGLPVNFELVEELRENADKRVSIDHGIAIQRDTDGTLHVHQAGRAGFKRGSQSVTIEGQNGSVVFRGKRILWEIARFAGGTFRAVQRAVNCECLDATKLGTEVLLRHWRPGDRFQPLGMASPIKLQDLFTNHKVPTAERRELIVGETAGGEIFWVEGLRLGERFKLDKSTRYQLKWRWERL